ncbi:MAG: DUF6160 family protein [Thalassolituus sp.]|uniref:DUF6160 family protein n=1 Tax=Thalassolituus sp. TaxID=2030822 RepID=UPI003982139B
MKLPLLSCLVLLTPVSAFAELVPASDFELASATGQAGVDLTLDFDLTIGEIKYTDDDVFDGGSLSVSGVTLGGGAGRTTLFGQAVTNTSRIDNLTFAIDVDSTGALVIDGGSNGANGEQFVDFNIHVDQVALKNASNQVGAVLVDSMNIYGALGQFRTVISEQEWQFNGLPVNRTTITGDLSFGIDDLDLDLSSMLGVQIYDAVLLGGDYIDDTPGSSLASFHYAIAAFDEGVGIDFKGGAAGQNVFDLVMPTVYVGNGLIGGITLDDVSIRGVDLFIAGH